MTALFGTKILLVADSREPAIAFQTLDARAENARILVWLFFPNSHQDGKGER